MYEGTKIDTYIQTKHRMHVILLLRTEFGFWCLPFVSGCATHIQSLDQLHLSSKDLLAASGEKDYGGLTWRNILYTVCITAHGVVGPSQSNPRCRPGGRSILSNGGNVFRAQIIHSQTRRTRTWETADGHFRWWGKRGLAKEWYWLDQIDRRPPTEFGSDRNFFQRATRSSGIDYWSRKRWSEVVAS